MVFEGNSFRGMALEGYIWPDGIEWLSIEVRTSEGWFVIQENTYLVCPD